mmetsp:Transcript_2570/g.4308  ORF Transcript_2570/g.4308 Transcript_2570/m.4308 type:complete len:84 (+) Transcript_2570:150-401(+)
MLILFYIYNGVHWWGVFSFGISNSPDFSFFNLVLMGTALVTIGFLLFFGRMVNVRKVTHDFYVEVISEERQKLAEEQARQKQR